MRRRPPVLARGRRIAGWAVVAIGVPALTAVLVTARGESLAVDLLLYLGLVVVASTIGGTGPGVAGALVAAGAANYYVVPPLHRLRIAKATDVVALAMFTAVGLTVSTLVNRSERRAAEALRARAEAEALAASTATLVAEPDPLPALLDHLRRVLGLDAAAVLAEHEGAWLPVASSGTLPGGGDGSRVTTLATGDRHRLAVHPMGHLSGADLALLDALGQQLALALTARELRAEAARLGAVESADALRTALLRAVSHDLRTPIASIKAAISSLLGDEVSWSPDAVDQFHRTIDAETDRLDDLVGNLLDMSRLQVGAVDLRLEPVALDDVVGSALVAVGERAADVDVAVGPDAPLVLADAALLERVVANLLTNAIEHAPDGTRVSVRVGGDAAEAHVAVVDHGPGVRPDQTAHIVEPFQRLDDGSRRDGVGLGLAVANGFATAMGGRLAFDPTPGGGLTASVHLPAVTPPALDPTDEAAA